MIVPRPAATVALLRDGERGIEAYLLRRNRALAFVPGATVYPGGAVDDGDHDVRWPTLVVGRTDASASLALGYPPGALAWWIAAVRECFEEVGVLLAVDGNGDPPPNDGAARRAQDRCRDGLLRGRYGLAEVCLELGLRVDLAGLRYLAHFVTPAPSPRRYDTRFFVATVPAGVEPTPDNGELVAGRWATPSSALAEARAGQIELIIPTACTLAAIGRFDRVEDLFEALDGHAAEVPTVADSMGRRARLPGDPPLAP